MRQDVEQLRGKVAALSADGAACKGEGKSDEAKKPEDPPQDKTGEGAPQKEPAAAGGAAD